MNERIKELIEQATTEEHDGFRYFDKAKFAKLIVQECVGICEEKTDHLDPNMYEVWRGALACASDIKVHFGVEE
jgi:hypothetical protein